MNLYLGLPLLATVALLQSVLLGRVDLLGARPDLMFLLILSWATVRDAPEALVWAFVGGLLIDLFSMGPLGATALALLAVAFLAGQPWGQGIGSPLARLLILALVGALVYHLILLLALAWTGHTVDWGYALPRVAGPSALLNMAFSPFVWRPAAWLGQKMRRKGLTL